jgi:hypothetical protein
MIGIPRVCIIVIASTITPLDGGNFVFGDNYLRIGDIDHM